MLLLKSFFKILVPAQSFELKHLKQNKLKVWNEYEGFVGRNAIELVVELKS